MEITDDMMIEINEELSKTFQPVYDEFVQPYKKIKFEEYLATVTEDTWEDLRNLMEVTNETLQSVAKRRQVSKKRWVKRELESKVIAGFKKEIELVAHMLYEQFKDLDTEKFKSVYGFDTYEELKQFKTQELVTWESSADKLMCHYPYFKYKKRNQIDSSLANDIKYVMVKWIKEKYPRGEQGAIISMPNSITKLPYDHTNRGKLDNNKLVENKFYREVYFINDKTIFESRLSVEALQEGLMLENLKLLNSLDHDILFYLMSLKHEALYQSVPMVVEIGEIVRSVYGSIGINNYKSVKESLIKMDFIELRVIDESTLRTTKVEIFHKVTIEMDEVTKKEVARIIFSEDLIHEFVKNQTVSIYKKIIDRFTLNSSKVLIYPLQRQRIACASQAEEGEKILFSTNITFFRGALVFGTSKRKSQITVIEKALDEIKANNITLKDYTRKGDNFVLEFYPFTDKEKRDLLNEDAPEKFLLQRAGEPKKDIEQLQMTLGS